MSFVLLASKRPLITELSKAYGGDSSKVYVSGHSAGSTGFYLGRLGAKGILLV